MKKLYFLLSFIIAFSSVNAQNEFFNNGATVTVEDGGSIYIQGELINTNAGNIKNDGLIELSGDYTNNATFDYTGTGATKTVRFRNLSVNTQIATGVLNFYNIEIENNRIVTGGIWSGGVELVNDATVENTLTFNTASSKLALKGNDVTVTNPSLTAIVNYGNDAYVQLDNSYGSLYRYVVEPVGPPPPPPLELTSDYDFPLGTETYGYHPGTISVKSLGGATEKIEGSFRVYANPLDPMFKVFTCTNLPQPPAAPNQNMTLNKQHQNFGYWVFSPYDNSNTYVTANDFNYDITLHPTQTSIDNSGFDYWKIVKLPQPTPPGSGINWGPHVDNSGNLCQGLAIVNDYVFADGVTATNLNSFSHFMGAGNDGISALPIELLYLRAVPVDNKFINVEWATSVEIDNSGFEVERRTADTDFEKIGWVDGYGNTIETQLYALADHNVVPNTVYYYRLKQIDYNGNFEYTHVVSAMISLGNVFTVSDFIPNPTNHNSRLIITSSVEKVVTISLYNTLGQIITNKKVDVKPGSTEIPFDFGSISDGTYHAIIVADNDVINRKIVITK